MEKTKKVTAAGAFMEALQEAGVSYIFSNLGSDHSGFIESWAIAKEEGLKCPEVIICPHEMVALSAAQGYAEATGEPQVVLVHVDCGTLNLGGAIHNVGKGRVPVLIFSGATPITQEGELRGSRNEFIHWIQDVFDQRGSVREYMKYTNEIRTGKNIKQMTHRSLQIATSEPQGPVYLMAAREVLEEEVDPPSIQRECWQPIAPTALPPELVKNLVQRMREAKSPLIITSYLGRNEAAVGQLVQLAERLAIPVIESCPKYVNFPANHPLHLGYIWYQREEHPLIAEADFILVVDSDLPWIPIATEPSDQCFVAYIDIDPLKEKTPMWYIPAQEFYRANSLIALRQINEYLDRDSEEAREEIQMRHQKMKNIHFTQRKEWQLEQKIEGHITPQWLTARISEAISDEDIVINETVTNFEVVSKHLPRSQPGTLFTSGGSSLGWSGGGALGMKLANPDKLVISLVGDGTYKLSNPTPVHWMSRRYNLPFLTIIYNNEGWRGPKQSTLGVYPDGVASRTNQFWNDFSPSSRLAEVAQAAGDAFAKTITEPTQLEESLQEAINTVKGGRSAVLDVRLPKAAD